MQIEKAEVMRLFGSLQEMEKAAVAGVEERTVLVKRIEKQGADIRLAEERFKRKEDMLQMEVSTRGEVGRKGERVGGRGNDEGAR